MKTLGRFFSYISENLREEINSFPLFIPVFIGAGIGYYFHLENEPSSFWVNCIFVISAVMLLFMNLGNSSDKVRHYKFVVFFSTLKYVVKKLVKFLLFALLFPIIGHITLFILIGGWIVSVFEYSSLFRYFALIYDNALMKWIWRGMKIMFSPLLNRIGGGKIKRYSKDVIKKTKKEKVVTSVWHLIVEKTKKIAGKVSDWIFSTFDNALFRWIRKSRESFYYWLQKIWNRVKKNIQKVIPRNILSDTIKMILSLNYILFFFILGVFVIKFSTDRLETKLLKNGIDSATIEAGVIESEFFENSYRLTFDNVKILDREKNKYEKDIDADIALDKIRVKFDKFYGLPDIGRTLVFTTSLIPPFEPMNVDGFNFARYSYYKNLSASGRADGGWKYVENGVKNSKFDRLFFKFLNLRNKINFVIEQNTSKDISGVIMSIMTGERYSVPYDVTEKYKGAGISHLLAISGFHMTLIVGFTFFLVRFLLALCVPLATKYNTKKIAVWFALLFSVFYLFVSGARLPTERAFIMTILALFAVSLDRNPLSLRFVAVSAIVILLLSPDALINAGFQMSFVAVVTLIRLYEVRKSWIIETEEDSGRIKKLLLKLFNAVWATGLTAFFIGISIMPFVVYNFNMVQMYSVLGNICAIPLFSFIVMPAILFTFLFMPFGMEKIFLKIVEIGINGINFCAGKVAELPYSSIDVKSMGNVALICILFGMIWFFLWDRKWKRAGILFIIVGCVVYYISKTPDVLANRYGTVFAINNKTKKKLEFVMLGQQKQPSKMLSEDWLKHIGENKSMNTKKMDFSFGKIHIGFAGRYRDYKNTCLNNDILFVSFDKEKVFYKCHKPVFDRNFWNTARGAEFYLSDNKIYFKTVAEYVGNRPWAYDYKSQENQDFDTILSKFK